MKKITIMILASFCLIGCSGNTHSKSQTHEEKFHKKGVAIERHAPQHASNIAQEAARAASLASYKPKP